MPHFFAWWDKERIKRKIKLRILHKHSARGKRMTNLAYSETKYLPRDMNNPAVVNIYGNRVVNVLWKGDYPVVFQLINEEIAESYTKYFDLLWKTAKK